MSSTPSGLESPLSAWHQAQGARLVEFGGWLMPLQYTTITEEHHAVRQRVGLFDISHMGRIAFDGPEVLGWLNQATTNDVARLVPGRVQYSLMVHDQGGILDDVLVYCRPRDRYGLVCNAANRPKVLAQFERLRAHFDATLDDQTLQTAMFAVQGPKALEVVSQVVSRVNEGSSLADLSYYHESQGVLANGAEVLVSRTGYTGEDGFELVVPRDAAEPLWNALLDAGRPLGLLPCGLGARDTLRFEAAMPLYGHELSETINPYAAGVGWAVKLNKGDFVGREALRHFKDHPGAVRVGLALEGKRIARQGATVLNQGQPVGTVTSGTFAPTLQRSLAMALVDPAVATEGTRLAVDVRGHQEPAQVVHLPFYQRSSSHT